MRKRVSLTHLHVARTAVQKERPQVSAEEAVVSAARERCTQPSAHLAAKKPRYLSHPVETSRSTVLIASRTRRAAAGNMG